LIEKLEQEKDLWAMCYQRDIFGGGIVVCDRIAKIKSTLKQSFLTVSPISIEEAMKQLWSIDE